MTKRVAVYGTVRSHGKYESRRYEFYGSGDMLYRAVKTAMEMPPKNRFVTVRASHFMLDPEDFADEEGVWSDVEANSP